jgi:hypothetical protein
MKINATFGFILLMLLGFNLYSQDTIVNHTGETLIVKILDTIGNSISFIPIESLNKDKIAQIKYKNGLVSNYSKPIKKPLKEVIAEGKKVYLSCEDKGGAEHLFEAINKWNYWTIVPDIRSCDFVLNLDITLVKKALAHITIIDPIDNEILLDVPTSFMLFGDHFNPKRAVILKNIGEKLIPLVKETSK